MSDKIYTSTTDLIGHTPILKLNRKLLPDDAADVYLKLEYLNPTGSIKDRVAKAIIEDAEKTGELKPGDTIVEPTSGNTGIGIAAIGDEKGYPVIIVMPDNMSIERQKIIKSYGAEIILTPGQDGMTGSIKKAYELGKLPNHFVKIQFSNPANPKVHEKTTGPEIIKAFELEKLPDAFIAGIGTGGTLTGVGHVLRQHKPSIEIYGIEPAESPVINHDISNVHEIEGIGADFIPDILDQKIYDDVLEVPGKKAIEYTKKMGKELGIMPGVSTGANVYGAILIAQQLGRDKKVLTIAPDYSDRYLSTDLFDDN